MKTWNIGVQKMYSAVSTDMFTPQVCYYDEIHENSFSFKTRQDTHGWNNKLSPHIFSELLHIFSPENKNSCQSEALL